MQPRTWVIRQQPNLECPDNASNSSTTHIPLQRVKLRQKLEVRVMSSQNASPWRRVFVTSATNSGILIVMECCHTTIKKQRVDRFFRQLFVSLSTSHHDNPDFTKAQRSGALHPRPCMRKPEIMIVNADGDYVRLAQTKSLRARHKALIPGSLGCGCEGSQLL